MTVFTGGHGMNAHQRKFSFIVVELNPFPPTLLVVTLVALFSLLTFMNVIGFVAVITELAELFLVGIAPVAVQAHQLGVALHQLEFSVLVVTEFHLGPFDKAMALVALFTHTPFMIIITPVTVDTCPLQFFLEIVVLVTGIAFRLIMGATKRKLGFIVVELCLRPAGGVMAFVAFLFKPSLMNIVESVTGETFLRCIFVTLIGMTAVARHLLVFSRQPEFGFVVVEPSPTPRPFGMAFGAGFSQPAEVGVVFFMTIDTTRGGFPVFFTGSMAMAALDGTMLALEDEIRGFMIEDFQVQLNNVCGPAFMVGVTMLALLPLHLGIAAMKPFFLFEVNAHRLVARQALLILPALFE